MYYYAELLKKAKISDTYTKEEWFDIFQVLIGIKNKEQFNMDWENS